MKKGIFIVLDGSDGSGKATQTALLRAHFEREGTPVLKVDFPAYDRNTFGALLGECLAGKRGDFVNLDPKIASSLYALDRYESTPEIRQALADGKMVIADRFTSSNQIHQGGKIANEEERKAFLLWLDKVEHEILGVPRPDLIVHLRVPLEVSLDLLSKKRAAKNQTLEGKEKDVVEEDRNYLHQGHETAKWLARNNSNWCEVDCMHEGVLRTPEAIHEDVWKEVAKAVVSNS